MYDPPPLPVGPTVTVWIPAQLRSLTNGQEMVRVIGGTVREVIAALDHLYPGIKARLCDGDALRPGLAVAVGTQIATLGLLQPVPEGSEVHFLPAVAGGQAANPERSPCRDT
jgi:molybdopterin synthase sulfur carrier subunit